jgi:hypothetical protein
MSCLFISCGKHLHVDPKKLRSQVVKVIRELPHLPINDKPLSWWIEQTGSQIDEYANKMEKTTTFGTAIEIAIISILYRRTIFVMKNQKKISEFFPEFGNGFSIVFSGPSSGGHFEAF